MRRCSSKVGSVIGKLQTFSRVMLGSFLLLAAKAFQAPTFPLSHCKTNSECALFWSSSIAEIAWLTALSFCKSPVRPICLNPPYMATNSVPGGKSLQEDSSNATSVMSSSVTDISELVRSMVFTHGHFPLRKYRSCCERAGVPPDFTDPISPRVVRCQPLGSIMPAILFGCGARLGQLTHSPTPSGTRTFVPPSPPARP